MRLVLKIGAHRELCTDATEACDDTAENHLVKNPAGAATVGTAAVAKTAVEAMAAGAAEIVRFVVEMTSLVMDLFLLSSPWQCSASDGSHTGAPSAASRTARCASARPEPSRAARPACVGRLARETGGLGRDIAAVVVAVVVVVVVVTEEAHAYTAHIHDD